LYSSIDNIEKVLVRSRISETHAIVFSNKNIVFNEKTIVFAFDDNFHFSLLQSNIHEAWMRQYTSTLRTDINYAPTDCFENSPPQKPSIELVKETESIGGEYHEYRRQIMLNRQQGLTKTYNLFNGISSQDLDIARLRELHVAMDNAVLKCYGWQDIHLKHDFYQNDRGQIRYTISSEARKELLRRLLELNLKIAAEE
jgi:hypothetical protein